MTKSMPDQIRELGFPARTGVDDVFWRKIKTMHARPQVREILVAKKMRRWVMIAKHPSVLKSYSPARARKNYGRLFNRYPEIAQKIGLHEFSAF
jgi:hypothetical protein